MNSLIWPGCTHLPYSLFSGLGYVIGSSVTSIAKGGDAHCIDCWQWGIRATPIIGIISLIALIVGVEEPVNKNNFYNALTNLLKVRGQAEAEENESITSVEDLQQK
jgi:hypothetical protein